MLIERSQPVIGAIVGVLLLAGTAVAVTMQTGALQAGDDIVIELADANRVESGAPLHVAGVRVGQVLGVELAGDRVRVTVRTPEPVPADSTAAVTTTNALGARAVSLELGNDWDDLLNDRDEPVIPLERTESLVDLPEVSDETVALLDEADPEAATRALASLADVAEGQREEVGDLLDGLERVGGVVADSREELSSFLADTTDLLDVLDEADRDLVRTIDGVGALVDRLEARREELIGLASSTASSSSQVADLVEEERAHVDAALEQLGDVLAVVDGHQVDLAHALAYGGVAFEGFASVGYTQGEDNPYWGNILTSGAGLVGVDAFAGCEGVIEQVLDQVLGPGPECPDGEQSRVDRGDGDPLPRPEVPDPADQVAESAPDEDDVAGLSPSRALREGGGALAEFLSLPQEGE